VLTIGNLLNTTLVLTYQTTNLLQEESKNDKLHISSNYQSFNRVFRKDME